MSAPPIPSNITVTMDTVDYVRVCAYYNKMKSDDEQPIQKLARAEGGFSIDYPLVERKGVLYDANDRIHQLRWSNRSLITTFWRPFTQRQLDLLAEALKSVYGDDKILYE